jgi:hypothetical protein
MEPAAAAGLAERLRVSRPKTVSDVRAFMFRS